jgi:hypothetical protein
MPLVLVIAYQTRNENHLAQSQEMMFLNSAVVTELIFEAELSLDIVYQSGRRHDQAEEEDERRSIIPAQFRHSRKIRERKAGFIRGNHGFDMMARRDTRI